VYFHEEQRLRDTWLWLIVVVPVVVAFGALIAASRTPTGPAVLAAIIGAGVVGLIGLSRLETTITDEAVIVTFHGCGRRGASALQTSPSTPRCVMRSGTPVAGGSISGSPA
jgi:hypothetical protein